VKFKNRRSETPHIIFNVCLSLALGAIFLQIWILISSLESLLQGKYDTLWASALLSGAAVLCCALTAWTTTINFFKTKNQP